MKYLLDVDVLVAPCVREHEFHERVASWMNESARAGRSELITCSVTELGFLRTLAQVEPYGFYDRARKGFAIAVEVEQRIPFCLSFRRSRAGATAALGQRPKQITDGHLLGLAKAQGAEMATLDERIPGALVIPGKN